MNISFNKKFYSISAINKAVKAYKKIAVFKIINTKSNTKVQITSKDKEIKNIIADEFCNYVLAETQKIK